MASTALPNDAGGDVSRQLPSSITTTLESLRGRIYRYVWTQGLAAVVVCIGAIFWLSLAIDWFFEPPVFVRIAMIAIAGVAMLMVLYRWLLRRLAVPLRQRSLAVLLERRFRHFGDSLLTAVEFAEVQPDVPYSDEMLSHTRQITARDIGGVNLREVFNPKPLTQTVVLAIALAAATAIFAVTLPEAFGTWWKRSVLLSEELWPRHTQLRVAGFTNNEAIVAEGADFEFHAEATSTKQMPQTLRIEYTTRDGVSGRAHMRQEGNTAGDWQPFSHVFQSVKSDISFDLVGGDARLRDMKLRVVPNPIISDMQLECDFPPYTGRGHRILPRSSLEPLPRGAEIVLLGSSNKELKQVEVHELKADQSTTPVATLTPDDGMPSPTEFRLPLGRLEADRVLGFTLLDTDGIKSREPVYLELKAKPDTPPLVSVRRYGIGQAVTDKARLPLRGEISDDFGVAKTWVEFAIEGAKTSELPFIAPIPVEVPDVGDTTAKSVPLFEIKLPVEKALEVKDMKVPVGQTFTFTIKAADTYESGPNIGSSEPFTVRVVTEDQLHAILEARELALRRRFEAVIKDLLDHHANLGSITFVPDVPEKKPEQKKPEDKKPEDKKPDDKKPETKQPEAKEIEPPPIDPKRSPEEELAWRKTLVQRQAQSSQRNSEELRGLVSAFMSIVEELENNRVESDRHGSRLKEKIARPINRVVTERFPILDNKLERLLGFVADPRSGEDALVEALKVQDAILVELNHVLDEMVQLETFNEVVAMMRMLIESQKNITQQTKEKQREEFRRLLEKE